MSIEHLIMNKNGSEGTMSMDKMVIREKPILSMSVADVCTALHTV